MNIVILGAGYAGLRAALELAQLRAEGRSPAVTITLVDQEPYHQIVVLLHQAATASATERQVALPLDEIVGGRGIVLRQGRAAAVDLAAGQLRLATGETVEHDRLIIAVGGTTSYAGVPEAKEHTLPLRTYREAVALREHILGRYRDATGTSDPKQRRQLMTVAIVGGGYTGVQLAGELSAWLPMLSVRLGLDPADVRIALIDRAPQLFAAMGAWASTEAARALDARRVSLYLNTSVEGVEPGALLLDGARRMRAGTMVWAGGVVAPALLHEAGLPTAQGGRVVVDSFLRAYQQGQQVVYAAGDCAVVRDRDGRELLATASYALRQGNYLARQIAAELRGEAAQPYKPNYLGEIVSLGPGRAVGRPLGVPLLGLPAALLKRGIEEWYLTTLQPGSVGAIL